MYLFKDVVNIFKNGEIDGASENKLPDIFDNKRKVLTNILFLHE